MCRVYKYIYGVLAEYMIINHARDHASSSDSVKSLATTERKYLNVEIMSYRRQTNVNKKSYIAAVADWTGI